MIQETSYLGLTNENDQTSSVKVKSGCTLKLFKHHNDGVLLSSLTADLSFLGAYNDQVSSLSCTCQGNVCFIKIRSKHNSNTLLSLLQIFMKQTLAS